MSTGMAEVPSCLRIFKSGGWDNQQESRQAGLQLKFVTGTGVCQQGGVMKASQELRRAQDTTLRSPCMGEPTKET